MSLKAKGILLTVAAAALYLMLQFAASFLAVIGYLFDLAVDEFTKGLTGGGQGIDDTPVKMPVISGDFMAVILLIAGGLCILLLFVAFKKGETGLSPLARMGRFAPLSALFALIAGGVFNIFTSTAVYLTGLDKLFPQDTDLTETLVSGNPVLAFAAVALLVPVVEELVFRGVSFRALSRGFGAVWAILFSSLAFAIIHMNMLQFIYTLPAGVLLCLCAYWSDSLWTSVLMHIGFNGISLVAAWAQDSSQEAAAGQDLVYLVVLAVTGFVTAVCIGIIYALSVIRRDKEKAAEAAAGALPPIVG